MVESSFFVTQFVIYSAPGLVKIEAFDLEPTMGSNKSIVLEKGPAKRLVMQEQTARSLYKALEKHLAHYGSEEQPNKNGLAFYENVTRINSQARRGVDKMNLEKITAIFSSLSGMSSEALRTVSAKAMDIVSRFNDKDCLPNIPFKDSFIRDVSDVMLRNYKAEKKSKAVDLVVAMTGYILYCAADDEKTVRHLKDILGELE